MANSRPPRSGAGDPGAPDALARLEAAARQRATGGRRISPDARRALCEACGRPEVEWGSLCGDCRDRLAGRRRRPVAATPQGQAPRDQVPQGQTAARETAARQRRRARRGTDDIEPAVPTRSVIPAVVRGLRQLPPTAPESTAAAVSRPDPVAVDALLSGLPGAVYRCVAGPGRPIVFLAGRVVEVLGSDGPPARGSSLDRLVHPDEREKVARMLADVVAGTPFSLEYRIHTDDGRERWVLDRGRAAMAEGRLWLEGVLIDATPERRMREELARLALYDALTGLPNRRALLGRAAREVALALSGGTAVSLVLLDVDHFKRVNDAFGHGVGDRVLVELAAALRARVPDGGLVGRLGGEEFALLAPGVGAESLFAAGERVRAAGERVIVGTGPITLSAGAATLTAGEDHASLIARADAALYRAKESGRDRLVLD